MNIIWVSPSGSNIGGDGTRDHPYATIEYALSVMVDGDQIRLLDGTYTPTDTLVVSGVSGSIFAENPLEVYIQPQTTSFYDAVLAVIGSPRFSVTGITILQAVDKLSNSVGMYIYNSDNFIAYTCNVSHFDILSGIGYGIFAHGDGRIERCQVDNFNFAGTDLWGIRSQGMDVIDCTVAAVSGAGLSTIIGIGVTNL